MVKRVKDISPSAIHLKYLKDNIAFNHHAATTRLLNDNDILDCFRLRTLDSLIKNREKGFADVLLDYIDKSGKTDSEIYNQAMVVRQTFFKIKNNPDYPISKPLALSFCIALKLNLEQTQDLLSIAGYTLNKNNKLDIIVSWFIEHEKYNITEINDYLAVFGETRQLGSAPFYSYLE